MQNGSRQSFSSLACFSVFSMSVICLPYTQAVTSLPPPSSTLQTTSAGTLPHTGADHVVAGNVFFLAFLWLCPRLTSVVRFSIYLLLHSIPLPDMNSVLHIEKRRATSS